MVDVQNRGALHGMLNLGTIVGRDVLVQHSHFTRVQAQLNTWIGRSIDPTLVNRGLYFVVVCERGKHAGLEDSNR